MPLTINFKDYVIKDSEHIRITKNLKAPYIVNFILNADNPNSSIIIEPGCNTGFLTHTYVNGKLLIWSARSYVSETMGAEVKFDKKNNTIKVEAHSKENENLIKVKPAKIIDETEPELHTVKVEAESAILPENDRMHEALPRLSDGTKIIYIRDYTVGNSEHIRITKNLNAPYIINLILNKDNTNGSIIVEPGCDIGFLTHTYVNDESIIRSVGPHVNNAMGARVKFDKNTNAITVEDYSGGNKNITKVMASEIDSTGPKLSSIVGSEVANSDDISLEQSHETHKLTGLHPSPNATEID